MKPKKRTLLSNLMDVVKPIVVTDSKTDYLEYNHLTGDKVFHGRLKEAIKIRTPYMVGVNISRIEDIKSKLSKIIKTTYYTVDNQSVNETIIDIDIIATTYVTEGTELKSSETTLRPILDSQFNQLVASGKILLDKPNIEYEVIHQD